MDVTAPKPLTATAISPFSGQDLITGELFGDILCAVQQQTERVETAGNRDHDSGLKEAHSFWHVVTRLVSNPRDAALRWMHEPREGMVNHLARIDGGGSDCDREVLLVHPKR